MRSVFPAEMYKDDLYRVVHGQEEEAAFAKLGWTEEMPSGKERTDYKVYHHEAPGSPAVKRGPGRPPLAAKAD